MQVHLSDGSRSVSNSTHSLVVVARDVPGFPRSGFDHSLAEFAVPLIIWWRWAIRPSAMWAVALIMLARLLAPDGLRTGTCRTDRS